jgi:type IV pilus assembly protein PilY1
VTENAINKHLDEMRVEGMRYGLTIKILSVLVVYLWMFAPLPTSLAARLDLSDSPLFLELKVEPNIFFVIDDSGSMDWEIVSKDTANDGRLTGTQPNGTSPSGSGSVRHRDSDNNGTVDCGFGINGQSFYGYIYGVEFSENSYSDDSRDCNTADDQEWRFRNSDFNPLYFNPARTYTPWPGVDANGNLFGNMPITAAKANPYNPNSETINLTMHSSDWPGGTTRATADRNGDGVPDGFRYYTWSDANGNGRFDNGEQTEHFIKDKDAATQQNFANWFSYYRSRELVAKAAYGQVIANATNVRMGLGTINNNNNAKRAIASMNADPTTGNKRALLDTLYSIQSADATPLQTALKNAGLYFECKSNTFFSSCPALAAADGGICQQNFAILQTDGYYNGSSPSVGNTDGPGNGNTNWDGGAYADGWSDTLADVAMRYYERDLQTSLADNVPSTTGVDEAKHQHMVTYSVAFGVSGSLTSNPSNPTTAFAWPNPANSNAAKIDDLRHAAYNGRGEFLDASNPNDLINALNAAIHSIEERNSSAAAVALNSGSHSTDSRVYQARFRSGEWSGQLLSFPIDADGQISSLEWDAAVALGNQNYDTGRTILTYNPSTLTGVPFRWAQLSTAQQTFLHTNPSGGNDGQGAARLDYLRGSTAHEGTGNDYRIRLKRLGDLINSDPFYVGAPAFPDSIGSGYASFRTTYASRSPIVYVGANDGMLHGFSAVDGSEKIAYVPNKLYANLHKLTDPAYSHRYYADGSPTIGDVFGNFGSSRCSSGSCWRSVLVSGLRKGGQGYFALDITDPNTFLESNANKLVLWEFTDAHDADLGYSFSQPSIVKMSNGKWAAVFGNGYNNSEADGAASTTGHAVLYILFLDMGLDGVWTSGTDYIKISTGVGESLTPNGLATVAPINIDGVSGVEYIYGGDLRGNVWRFDVRDSNPSNWAAPTLIFTATNASNNPQPITSRLEVGAHPNHIHDPVTGGVLVYFGTGKYLENGDHITTGAQTQTFYSLWDKLETNPTLITRSSLLPQTVLAETGGKRVTSNTAIDWNTNRGWYLDLPTTGERVVSDPILRNKRIIFTTLIPNPDICNFGGTSWLMELNAHDGARLATSPFDFNNDDLFDDNDKVTVSIDGTEQTVAASGVQSTEGILPTSTVLASGNTEIKYNSGSAGGIFVTTEDPGAGAKGRLAWREF